MSTSVSKQDDTSEQTSQNDAKKVASRASKGDNWPKPTVTSSRPAVLGHMKPKNWERK